MFGLAFFISLFFIPQATPQANACVLDDQDIKSISLVIDPDQAAEKTSQLLFRYTVTVTDCTPDQKKELEKLRWYIFQSNASGKTEFLKYPDVGFPVPLGLWQPEKNLPNAYTVEKAASWAPFGQLTGTRLEFKPELVRTTDNKILATGDPVTVALAGTPPPDGNSQGNAQGNNCTGNGCGGVTNSDFDTTVGNFINPINIDSFPELVLFVMKGIIFLIGIMAVLMIIIGGVRMVISQGNQESVTKGKQTIIWAVAGLIVALLSFSLVSIVQNLLSKP